MSFASLLNARMEVRRIRASQDAYWSQTQDSRPQAVLAPCRIQPLRADERVKFGALRAEATHKLWFHYAEDLAETDEVVIGGETYQVLAVGNPAGAGHHKLAILSEMR